MNFTHMPELDEWWGYPTALAIIAGISLFLFRYLRSRHWI
jgi:magnesium transporter